MITSEQVTEQLEANKTKITHKIAEKMMQRQVGHYTNMTIAQIEQSVIKAVEMVLNYFCTSNTAILKTSTENLVNDRLKKGYGVESVQVAIEVIAEVFEQEINTITAKDVAVRDKFKGRLDSVKALSKVSWINQNLNKIS